MGAFDHTGFLGNAVRGKALEGLVCATASSGFLLFGYDRKSTSKYKSCFMTDSYDQRV